MKHKFSVLFVLLPGILSEIKLTLSHEKNIILTKKVLVHVMIVEEYARFLY